MSIIEGTVHVQEKYCRFVADTDADVIRPNVHVYYVYVCLGIRYVSRIIAILFPVFHACRKNLTYVYGISTLFIFILSAFQKFFDFHYT